MINYNSIGKDYNLCPHDEGVKIVVYATNFVSALNFTTETNVKKMSTDRIGKLEEYLQKQPDDSFLLHALALEYIKLGDDEKGKNLFTHLLAINPDYVGSYYHLAKVLERLGDTNAALQTYEQGIAAAKNAGDRHAQNELQMAFDELADW